MVSHEPLIRAITKVLGRVGRFKERARFFYFEVILSTHQCTHCGGRLSMSGKSECSCSCGRTFDPTIAFQKSNCCNAKLVRKTFHYACSLCNEVVPSRFLFDEKVFDASYFKEMMAESRKRKKQRKEEVRRLLAMSRSTALPLMDEPNLDSIPRLIQDLDDFVGVEDVSTFDFSSEMNDGFSLKKYREHILSVLNGGSRMFSDIKALNEDPRLDKIWRFITLIFMRQDRDVELTQYGNDLLVESISDEGYSEEFPGTAQIAL